MMYATFTKTVPVSDAAGKWSVKRLLLVLLRTRQEIRRISLLARRERLQLGYQRVPQRVWDRRSALFIDR